MRVVLSSYGSREDVEPKVGLAVQSRRRSDTLGVLAVDDLFRVPRQAPSESRSPCVGSGRE
jgi:hypothetical protein